MLLIKKKKQVLENEERKKGYKDVQHVAIFKKCWVPFKSTFIKPALVTVSISS